MNEQARASFGWFKSKGIHAFAQMFIEQFGAVDLSINALVEFENDVLRVKPSRTVALRKFHVKRVVSQLWALTESEGEVDLARFPSICCSKKHAGTDSRPSNKRTVGDSITFLKIPSTAESAFEFAWLSIRQSLCSLDPSARDDLGAGRKAAARNDGPGSFAFKAGNFVIH
mgnify:CR=1 FL=1